MIIISMLGRQKQDEPWDSLDSQPSLLCLLQVQGEALSPKK